eukprot:806045-Pelagomonas_calceolata.AAC.3
MSRRMRTEHRNAVQDFRARATTKSVGESTCLAMEKSKVPGKYENVGKRQTGVESKHMPRIEKEQDVRNSWY